ncbi:Uncharacterised protein [Vibrio cholerae]|nr:Uncharacterised protein [Vibrio cholerae]
MILLHRKKLLCVSLMKVVLQKQQIEFRVDVPAGGHICHDRDALLQGLGLLVGAIIRRQSFKHIGNRHDACRYRQL